MEQSREAREAVSRIGMLGTKYFLVDRQRTFVKRSRCREFAQVLKGGAQAFETHRGIGMIEAERCLEDCERALMERSRPCRIPSQKMAKVLEVLRRGQILRAKYLLVDR